MTRLGRCSLALALALAAAGCPRATRPEPEGSAFALAALAMPSVDGRVLDVGALRGKVVLVSFFATWCFPCLANLPVLEKLQKDNAARGFTVVAVGMDLEGATVLEPWTRQYEPPYPVLVADDRVRGGGPPFGRIGTLPATVLLSRDGKVLLAFEGVASPEQLLAAVGEAVRH